MRLFLSKIERDGYQTQLFLQNGYLCQFPKSKTIFLGGVHAPSSPDHTIPPHKSQPTSFQPKIQSPFSEKMAISRFTPHLLSDLSDFSDLLSTTADLLHHHPRHPQFLPTSSTNVTDTIRYHVLLQYLTLHDLRRCPPSGKLITTLFQTTGRASANITHDSYTDITTIRSLTNNATVISPIVTLPYNVSIFTVDSLIIPYGFDLMASESRPLLGLNITKALIDGHNFNVAASMLSDSGVVQEIESEISGAGLPCSYPQTMLSLIFRRRKSLNRYRPIKRQMCYVFMLPTWIFGILSRPISTNSSY